MPMRRSKRLEPLAFFEGSWRGVNEQDAAGEPAEVHFTLELDLGGDWLSGGFVVGTGAETELEGKHVWGYDPLAREFLSTFFDSTGLFGTLRSKGWDGETWTWEGQATTSEQTLPIRQTITRTGPDSIEVLWEARFEKDRWTQTSRETMERDRDAPGKFLM